ncbi:unnamed protein product [Linum tenue]|uniref:Clp R domain-containing protein n=1 Tax=Linum tenue TaxID=586396 RepID=A0AAV0K152_9ROSI|nr:unnamed protein product [Linum tenue]
MPTPVSTARQCLTPEAAHALDEAVRVAKKRRHSQTTSLHAVSALLSHPSSVLRDACSRARNNAYSPRLQFKALDLCLGVSLDRVPSSAAAAAGGDDGDEASPPVSNSLMAAIKRSQANQRRQPENFHLYHHHQQVSSQQMNNQSTSTSSSISCIKVDLRNLIMSILDDPVVSRVFSDAGFRSPDIKLAVFRPLTVLPPFHFRPPPPAAAYSDPGPGRRGFSFPFPGFSGFFSGGGSENFRRIGEVLGKSKGRNPLLLGVCACDTLASFIELLEKKIRDKNDNSSSGVLPPELSGLAVIRLETEISQFLNRNSDKEAVDSRFEEVGRSLDRNSGPGLVLNFGDLKPFVKVDEEEEGGADGRVSYIVEKLTSSLSRDNSKLWLIGAAASYETYSKFVARFPSVVKEWDLQLLPITTSSSMAAESSYPKSSLMESFIPFGGFFPTPADFKVPLGSSPYHYMATLSHPCDGQEIVAVSKEASSVPSVPDQYQSGQRSWLQTAEIGTAKEGMFMKTRDDGEVLRCRAVSLQEKHDSMCHSLHQHQSPPGSDIHPTRFSTVLGFQLAEDTQREVSENDYSCCTTAYSRPMADTYSKPYSSSAAIDSHQIVRSESASCRLPLSPADASNNWRITPKQCEKPLNEDSGGALRSPHSLLSNSSMCYGSQASPASLTTDLGLRLSSPPAATGEPINLKDLCRDLSERVGWQNDDAIFTICQTISEFRARDGKPEGGRLRGKNIWFSFLGPDWHRKRKVATAVAEMIYGSKENLVYANLNPQDGKNGSMLRGKTVVDYVAGELCKRPVSVVLLENVDKADVQVQSSLSRAIQRGRFSDSHGREVPINNAIIITTSNVKDDSTRRDLSTYREDRVLKAKGWPLLISIEKKQLGRELSLSVTSDGSSSSSSAFLNKRKRADDNASARKGLDLNLLPDQENDGLLDNEGEHLDSDDFACDDHSSRAWLQGFFGQVDRVVMFKSFDFNALATRISNEMNKCFHKFVTPECDLEIDQRVMEQLLAAEYLSDKKRTVEDWIAQVLGRKFEEVRRKHGELGCDYIVKLAALEERSDVEELNPRGCLPPQVIIN